MLWSWVTLSKTTNHGWEVDPFRIAFILTSVRQISISMDSSSRETLRVRFWITRACAMAADTAGMVCQWELQRLGDTHTLVFWYAACNAIRDRLHAPCASVVGEGGYHQATVLIRRLRFAVYWRPWNCILFQRLIWCVKFLEGQCMMQSTTSDLSRAVVLIEATYDECHAEY